MADLSTYWHTIRYLKPIQILGRARYRFTRARPRRVSAEVGDLPNGWQTPTVKPAAMVGPTQFQFLNARHDLNEIGWDNPGVEKLWRYNLHYFDDLCASPSSERQQWHEELIARWIAENPVASGSGWEPYPVSLRIVNWIKWLMAGNRPVSGMAESLASQADWLTQRLEYHLLGNHLFANGKALMFAGLFCAGREAERWLSTGARILRAELKEQILADGGHFELSPMYHAIALDDVLDLINLLRAYGRPPSELGLPISAKLATSMLDWLATMTHPDGEISLFNDAAIGIAPNLADLSDYAGRLGVSGPTAPRNGLTHLPESGYIRLQTQTAVCIMDVAAIGPDYLPGHAHADTLSFELSIHGRRFIVNGGTSVYGTGPERLRQRGTAAHNTVVVAGQNSSEVWSGFRVARRARPIGLSIEQVGDKWIISCAHDGYGRLARPVTHHRQWTFQGRTVAIADSFADAKAVTEARLHFCPDAVVASVAESMFEAELPEGAAMMEVTEGDRSQLETASWHPHFGQSLACQCLSITSYGGPVSIKISW